MLVVITCPECGHLGRVPEKRLGHKVRCKGCGGTFRPDAAATQDSAETKKFAKKDLSPKKAGQAGPQSGFLGLLKKPTIIEGAVLGAISGIISGVIIGAITSAIYFEPKKGIIVESANQSAVGSAIGGGMTGFIIGFFGGTSIGAVIGLVGGYFQSESLATGWRRIVAFGMVIGAGVSAIIASEHFQWIPIGAVVGAGGALLWLALQNWERSSDVPLVRDFQWEEEEEKPTDAKTNL
jgi:hypothetical protein